MNGYLFAPWLVKPFPFLDTGNRDRGQSAALSAALATPPPPPLPEHQEAAGQDAEASRPFEPIKQRRRATPSPPEQGTLF